MQVGHAASQNMLATLGSCLKRTVLILTMDELKHSGKSTLKGKKKDTDIYPHRGTAVSMYGKMEQCVVPSEEGKARGLGEKSWGRRWCQS